MAAIRRAAAPVAAALLAGCTASSDGSGDWRESVGLAAPPPNEFLVVSRAPLEMPPSSETLPTPRPGAPSRVEPDPVSEARAALLGPSAAPAGPAPSAGERALADAAGPADPSVRQTLAAEAPERARRFGLESFGFTFPNADGSSGDRLDPEEEAARLRERGVPTPTAPPDPEA